jgi:dynein heavy chain
MPYSFKKVGDQSRIMLEVDRRYTYITPKSFLELLKLFISFYKSKIDVLVNNREKLVLGLTKLTEAKEKIGNLEKELEIQSVEIKEIKIVAEEKASIANEQASKVSIQKEAADKEEKIVGEMKALIQEEARQCKAELDKLKPLMEQTEELARNLDEKAITAAASLTPAPPQFVLDVAGAIIFMVAGQFPIQIEIDKNKRPKKLANGDRTSFLKNKGLKGHFSNFLEEIKAFKVDDKNFSNLEKEYPTFCKEELFDENVIKATKAHNASMPSLYKWVYNMFNYYQAAKTVEPKQRALEKKEEELAQAIEKLDKVMEEVRELNEALAKVIAVKEEAEKSLKIAVDRETACKNKLDLARRFINALASSKDRWEVNIKKFDEQLEIIIGDIIIASAFVSYVGPFPRKYREDIMKSFISFLKDNEIPFSPTASDPLVILTSDTEKARWNNQKLPADPVSIENATIFTNSERWHETDPQTI